MHIASIGIDLGQDHLSPGCIRRAEQETAFFLCVEKCNSALNKSISRDADSLTLNSRPAILRIGRCRETYPLDSSQVSVRRSAVDGAARSGYTRHCVQ